MLLGLIATVIAVGAATGMAYAASFSAIGETLRRLEPTWLVVVLAARLGAYAGYAIAHHRVMSACEESELEADTAAKVVAFGAGATSLRGGFSIDARALRGAGASRPKARAHVAALAMLEYAVLAGSAWICALLLIGRAHAQGAVVWPWVIGVPAGVALASLGYVKLAPATEGDGSLRGRVRSLVRGGEILAGQSRQPLRALTAAVGMAAYWAAEIAALWASFLAFGVDVSAPVAIAGYATGYVLTPRGLPLAGAGVAEVLVPLSLNWLGVGLAEAVVAVLAAEVMRLVVSIPFALLTRKDVQALVEAA